MSGRASGPAASARAAAFAARASYGRILAILAARTRDVAGAEDALSEAFALALEQWPEHGIPESPEAWLWTVARRKQLDAARHAALRQRPDIEAALRSIDPVSLAPARLPDERLRLLLVCAHPAIDPAIRAALMLQVVLGIEAKHLASAFLVSPESMAKRLVRAKAKLRASGIRFEEPEPGDLPARLHAVLEAIYGAYTLAGEGALADGDARDSLRDEAVYLARVVAEALPFDAEALGLAALLGFLEARRPARVGPAGEFIPLLEQDPSRWDRAGLDAAYSLLARAASRADRGPFQLEAAIAAAHSHRALTGVTPWSEIATLYRILVDAYPTIGATVGLAVAVAQAHDRPEEGLSILASLSPDRVRDYQPWWVAASHLHARAGRSAEAHRCLERAIGLTTHPSLRAFLGAQLRAIPVT